MGDEWRDWKLLWEAQTVNMERAVAERDRLRRQVEAWEYAVDYVEAHYPPDVFPEPVHPVPKEAEDVVTNRASATARRTCQNVRMEYHRRLDAALREDTP